MKCAYCGEDGEEWESGKTYKGLDEHHNPPKFLFVGEMKNAYGDIIPFGKKEWSGKTYFLCRKHHTELHKEIKKILNKIAGSLKFVNSEDWILKKMTINQINQARQEVYNFTEEWIKNGNTNKT